MPIHILYSDASLVAVNKPPGLAVHAAPGPGSSILRELRAQGLNGLIPVHRLDKDASGVLLLARSKDVARALEQRWDEVEKTYLALCHGIPLGCAGVISAPILENQTSKPERLRRALRYFARQHRSAKPPPPPAPRTSAVHPAGRGAQTEYRVIEAFAAKEAGDRKSMGARGRHGSRRDTWSWLEVLPRQGRMHQIRVHLAHIGCPIVGDGLYGRPSNRDDYGLTRMALHAAKLVFPHPSKSSERLTVEAPMAEDLAIAVERIRLGAGRMPAG